MKTAEVSLSGDPTAKNGHAYLIPDDVQVGELVEVRTPFGIKQVPVIKMGSTYLGSLKTARRVATGRQGGS